MAFALLRLVASRVTSSRIERQTRTSNACVPT
jgi:hypothetical protein